MRALVCAAFAWSCHSSSTIAKTDSSRLEVVVTKPETRMTDLSRDVVELEASLASTAHVIDVSSATRDGQARVAIELRADADVVPALSKGVVGARLTIEHLPRRARYVIADSRMSSVQLTELATAAVETIDAVPGLTGEIACGAARPVTWLEGDAAKLTATGTTIADLAATVESVHGQPGATELGELVIAASNGVPIRVRDVAKLEHNNRADPCAAVDARGDAVVVDVYAESDRFAAFGQGVLETRLGTLQPRVASRRIWVGLNDVDTKPEIELRALRDAVARVPNAADVLVELGGDDTRDNAAIDLVGDDVIVRSVIDAVCALPFVVGAGERTAAIEVRGDDRAALADETRELAKEFQRRRELVATRGVAVSSVAEIAIDHTAVARFGAEGVDVAVASSQPSGVRAGLFIDRGRPTEIRIRSAAPGNLSVRGASGFVRLADVISTRIEAVEREQLRSRGRPSTQIFVAAPEQDVRDVVAATHRSTVEIEIHIGAER